MKKKYFLLLPCLMLISTVSAQRIWAVEMFKETIEGTASVDVRVYRETESKDSIIFDWGDGTQETLPLGFTLLLFNGFWLDTYVGEHTYDTSGYYEIGFRDSFLIQDVVNISQSGNKSINIRDSIAVFPPDHPFDWNRSPDITSLPFTTIMEEDGIVKVFLSYQIDEPFIDLYLEELVPFPSEEFMFPEATDSIYMINNVVVWDKPTAPGIYAFCIKVREIRPDYFNPQDSVLMSTTHRAMMIEVDSNMIVSTMAPWLNNSISVFPNPATQTLYLESNCPGRGEGHILNAQGQVVQSFRREVTSTRLEVDVAALPPGIYWVRWQTRDCDLVEKVVIF